MGHRAFYLARVRAGRATGLHLKPRGAHSPYPYVLVAVLAGLNPGWQVTAGEPVEPPGLDAIDIDQAPVYLLSGGAPNLILTIDDSRRMNRAFLPDSSQGGVDPQLDPRDTSSLVNRQYYDPAQTYLPPQLANGRSIPHADFHKSAVDVFATPGPNCYLDLARNYAPTWDLTATNGSPNGTACVDLQADAAEQFQNSYSVDPGHQAFMDFREGAPLDVPLGRQWAWRCMTSNQYSDCPAFYYRLAPLDHCQNLNLNTIAPADFPLDCLERVEVGSAQDLGSGRNQHNVDITAQALGARRELLKQSR